MDAAVTISGNLIHQVRKLYKSDLERIAEGGVTRQGTNGYAAHAPTAYIISVASVEAFLNEILLSDVSKSIFNDSPLWNLSKNSIDRLELGVKLILIPQLLFAKTFSRGEQPYQDMALLIRIRNDFVHYKMQSKPPKYLKVLEDQRIALRGEGFIWVTKLSSSECIKWAHNTACKVVEKLISFVPDGYVKSSAEFFKQNFIQISNSSVRQWFITKGIDPDSNDPSQQ
jgi:hypothetical protein